MNEQFARAIAQSDLPSPDVLNRAQLWAAVSTYLAALAYCPTCQGKGDYALSEDQNVNSNDRQLHLTADSKLDCPTCQGQGHDPAHTDWHCDLGDAGPKACYWSRRQTDEKHQGCGWRISLPIPDLATGIYEPGD